MSKDPPGALARQPAELGVRGASHFLLLGTVNSSCSVPISEGGYPAPPPPPRRLHCSFSAQLLSSQGCSDGLLLLCGPGSRPLGLSILAPAVLQHLAQSRTKQW